MEATGSKQPLIYAMGEAPGKTEDLQGRQFVGKSGQILRMRIPGRFLDKIRWNNTVRTRPPDNRTPTRTEIECCRPSIVRDIEATKPKAIFAFGGVALDWAVPKTKHGNITNWSGRMVPVKIGKHVCWLFPFYHPSFVGHTRKFEPRGDGYGSDIEFKFAMDVSRALDRVEAGLPKPVVHSEAYARSGVEIVTGHQPGDLARVRQHLRAAVKFKEVGLDFENWPLRPYANNAKLLTAAVATPNKALAFAIDHKDAGWSDDEYSEINDLLVEFLMDPRPRKIVHNVAHEMEWVAVTFPEAKNCLWKSKWGDTQAQAFILDERQGALALEFLVVQQFGIQLKELSSVDTKDLRIEPLDQVLTYNAMDAKYHLALSAPQHDRLVDAGLIRVYAHHMRRIPACVLTQVQGVPVDQAVNKKFRDDLEEQKAAIEQQIAELPDVIAFRKRHLSTFRPSAPKDLGLLLSGLGIHLDSMEESQLKTIKHPIGALMLDWREVAKQLSTYVLPLTKGHEASTVWPDGKLHPILATMKTDTWRSASSDPNGQNFPKRDHKELRSQVKHKDETKVVVAFDYAGIQARNITMESKDPVLIKAFWERYDIHSDWRDQVQKLYPRWIPKTDLRDKERMKYWRNRAKNGLVFPSFFGAQPKKVAGELEVPIRIAEQVQEILFDRFRNVKKWHQRLERGYHELGYITGCSGFRRRAPISYNQIINSPIQADESLIVFDAYSTLSETCEPRYQPMLEIHDDLTFLMKKGDVERDSEFIISTMLKINYDWINVPLGVEVSMGYNWADMKTIGEYYSDKWNSEDPNTGNWSDGTGWGAVDKRKKVHKR